MMPMPQDVLCGMLPPPVLLLLVLLVVVLMPVCTAARAAAAPVRPSRRGHCASALSRAVPHLDAWVCVAQLWVVGHHVCTAVIATGKLEAQGLGQVHL